MKKNSKKKTGKSTLRSLQQLDLLALGGPLTGDPVNPPKKTNTITSRDIPTTAELNRWKYLDFDKGSNKIDWENNRLLTDRKELDDYLYEHPESRADVAAGRRVWAGPNMSFVMNAEDDAEFANRFYPPTAPAEATLMPTTVTKEPEVLSATGQRLNPEDYPVAEGQQVDRQYTQYAEQFANSPEQRAKRGAVDAQRAASIKAMEGMSVPEKKAYAHQQYLDMKSKKQLKSGGLIGEDGLIDNSKLALGGPFSENELAGFSLGAAGAEAIAPLIKNAGDDRSNQVAKGVTSGAVQYGAKGAELGAQFGPLGALIGGGAGLIGGAVLGGVQADKAKKQFYDESISSYANGGSLRDFHIMPDGSKMAGKSHPYATGGDLNNLQGDPSEVTEYNGMRHEQGGIAIGSKEVEDGEVRVGDYVFSDRLSGDDNRTFASRAKDITRRFEEHKNDGVSMRTQNKQLERLKFENDQAREQLEAEKAQQSEAMETDYLALGGLMHQDDAGKMVILPENKSKFIEASRAAKMGYGGYTKKFFEHSKTRDKLFTGGDIKDPVPNTDVLTLDDNEYKGLNEDLGLDLGLKPSGSDVEFNMGNESGGLGAEYYTDEYGDLVEGSPKLATKPLDQIDYGQNDPIQRELETPTVVEGEEEEESGSRFGNAELGLLAATVPAVANLMRGGSKQLTTFDRLELKEMDLAGQRKDIERTVTNAKKLDKENISRTAKDSGEALAALSASSARLTDIETDKKAASYASEANANVAIKNQEATYNNQTSINEFIARQQDDAAQNKFTTAGLASMSANMQGYIKDKGLASANKEYNDKVIALLNTGEYKMVKDEETGQYKPVHIATYDAKQAKLG